MSSDPGSTATPRARRRLAWGGLAVLLVAALGFMAGAVSSALRGWGSPVVSVVVENTTTTPVRLVTLQHSGCGGPGTLAAQNLQPGEAHTFRFLVCGEGGYKLDAMLENKMVLSSAAYVEDGYRVLESIGPFRISSQTRAHPL